MNMIASDRDVVYRAISPALDITRAYAEWRPPEIVITNCQVMDRVIANRELHSVAVVAATNLVVRVKHVIDRCADRVGSQPVVAIGSNSLIHVVTNDLTSIRIEDVDAIECVVAATGRHLRIAARNTEVISPRYANGVCERV